MPRPCCLCWRTKHLLCQIQQHWFCGGWGHIQLPLWIHLCRGEEGCFNLNLLQSTKAPGPDGLRGRILKECGTQLGGVMTQLFHLFLDASFVPKAWKETTIIPVPKKPNAKALNDSRPVALTSIYHPYKPRRGVEDASLALLDNVTRHLDSQHSFVRILFMDFSSAFNTENINTLLLRLQQL